jgi:hypothetical protein
MTMRKRLVPLFFAAVLVAIVAVPAAAAPAPKATGCVAVSPEMTVQVDGVDRTVQNWMEFEAHAAVGTPGEKGYRAAKGGLYYYVADVDTGECLYEDYFEVVDAEVSGDTATFELDDGRRVSVTDGGEPWTYDSCTVWYGDAPVPHPLYAGNIQVH